MRALWVLLVLPAAFAMQSPDAARTNMERLAAQSNFIFQGTVQRLNDSTEGQVPASPSTAVVRVDKLIQGADMASNVIGREITVMLLKPRSVAVGRSVLFYSNVAVVGKSVAVKEVGHVEAAASGQTAQAVDYAASKAQRALQQRVAGADLVVTGTVASVRAPERKTTLPPSEHDPEWTEAIITVQSTEKGSAPQRVVVWFPASDDIGWFRAPKLKSGQTGVFLLRRAAERGLQGFTALDPLDVQPAPERERVRGMIRAVR
jgi:hypothetical protein